MGTLVQPAHELEGLHIPERRYEVYYKPVYGVDAPRLCTSNGNPWEIALCVRDDTKWEAKNVD